MLSLVQGKRKGWGETEKKRGGGGRIKAVVVEHGGGGEEDEIKTPELSGTLKATCIQWSLNYLAVFSGWPND